MIRIEKMTKKYGNDTAVDGIDLTINKGELCVFIGPSGCGKSTTLRVLNRLENPDKGAVYINGEDISKSDPVALRRGIGYVIQNIGLFPHQTAAENIATVPSLLKWGEAKIAERVDYLLDLVGLEPAVYKAKYPSQLSGGEAQRIGVARALAADPEVLLMDEPFGALDPITRSELQSSLIKIQKELKKTIVFVTHDIDEAVLLADRIVLMKDGQIVQQGEPNEILERPANKFVRDFVGADRALKRLSLMKTEEFYRPVVSVKLEDEISSALWMVDNEIFVWVTDSDGKPVGWLDYTEEHLQGIVSDYYSSGLISDFSIHKNKSAKEALNRMIRSGSNQLAVTDDDGLIIGEICIDDIIKKS